MDWADYHHKMIIIVDFNGKYKETSNPEGRYGDKVMKSKEKKIIEN